MLDRSSLPVQLIAADIDGCLSPGLFRPYNLKKLQEIADFNNKSKSDPIYPPLTICTGRPEPYAEAVLQLVQSYYPAVSEHGGLLCGIDPPLMTVNPILPDDLQDKMLVLKQRIFAAQKADGNDFMLEPGKETHCTVFTENDMTVERLHDVLSEILRDTNLPFLLKAGRSCINVFPSMLHKGMGIEWLSRETGIPTGNMGGIGDSDNDVPFLEAVGYPASPSNGSDPAKAVKGCFVSEKPDIDGVLDFYRHCVEMNRRHAASQPVIQHDPAQAHSGT